MSGARPSVRRPSGFRTFRTIRTNHARVPSASSRHDDRVRAADGVSSLPGSRATGGGPASSGVAVVAGASGRARGDRHTHPWVRGARVRRLPDMWRAGGWFYLASVPGLPRRAGGGVLVQAPRSVPELRRAADARRQVPPDGARVPGGPDSPVRAVSAVRAGGSSGGARGRAGGDGAVVRAGDLPHSSR